MKHIAYIDKKPELSGKNSIPDGGITGNGDFSAVLGNSDNGMRIHLAKSDIWSLAEHHDHGGMKPLGYIDVDIPCDMYENYHCEQDADLSQLRCGFSGDGKSLNVNITVFKTANALLLETAGNIALPEARLYVGRGEGKSSENTENNIKYISREFIGEKRISDTVVHAGIKKLGEGRYIVFTATNYDVSSPFETVKNFLENADEKTVEKLSEEHKKAWEDFWAKSKVRLSDEKLENGWYQSVYLLAVCTGNKKFPPGLYGNFITVENPSWKSDYHLNYNYQAPFYSVCSSNHCELTDCYHAPLEDFMSGGRRFASLFGCRGILYPVGMMPLGAISEYQPTAKDPFLRLFLGQKSNHIHAADIMIFRWYAERDTEYAREHAYPYVKACLEFFEDYCTREKGRVCVEKDAAHEVPYYKPDFSEFKYRKYVNDKNNLLTLGLLRLTLAAGIDMAKALDIDEDKRTIWQDMLDNLADFPTYYRKFKKVFRYTEKGEAWNDGNSLGLQHIYPCGCIDLNSDEDTLKIARNSLFDTNRWYDDNATNSIFPCALRIGVEPGFVIDRLRENFERFLLPNFLFKRCGGCLENCSLIPNVINEGALQSNSDVLRFFPAWDKRMDCEYENLRANGAFLVSASIKNGNIGKIKIYSEKGSDLTYINPFNGKKITVETKPGEIIEIIS